MLIPLGILAASGSSGAMELISTVSLSADANTVAFASIPSNFKHLQIRAVVRGSAAANSAYTAMMINQAASTTAQHFMWSNGSSVQSGANTALSTWANIGYVATNNAASGVYTGMIIDILDYATTGKNKTARIFSGHYGADYRTELRSNLFIDTTAVNHIQFSPWDSANFKAGSRFSLYGIKG